jgi:hypothetical protein
MSSSLPTTDQLIEAAGRLPDGELNEFVRQVIHLGATRRAPALPARETELLQSIFAESCKEDVGRYQELIRKCQAESLSVAELEELRALSDRIEVVHAERMAAIAELARLRGVGLSDMMTQLGINPPEIES